MIDLWGDIKTMYGTATWYKYNQQIFLMLELILFTIKANAYALLPYLSGNLMIKQKQHYATGYFF